MLSVKIPYLYFLIAILFGVGQVVVPLVLWIKVRPKFLMLIVLQENPESINLVIAPKEVQMTKTLIIIGMFQRVHLDFEEFLQWFRLLLKFYGRLSNFSGRMTN